jgi:hypothetical protein
VSVFFSWLTCLLPDGRNFERGARTIFGVSLFYAMRTNMDRFTRACSSLRAMEFHARGWWLPWQGRI